MTVFGLGVEDGTHTGREMSEAKKTGLPVTKELSEELLSFANRGGKGSAFAVAAETTEMPQEAERN